MKRVKIPGDGAVMNTSAGLVFAAAALQMRNVAVERSAVLVGERADAARKRHRGKAAAVAAEVRMIE